MNNTIAKMIALMQHCKCNFDDLTDVDANEPSMYIEYGSAEYRVLTDSEADDAVEVALDSILDECVLPDLDEALQCYFDRDAWKRDAQYDGRGHHLNHYDGEEYEEVVNGVSYYIYRVN